MEKVTDTVANTSEKLIGQILGKDGKEVLDANHEFLIKKRAPLSLPPEFGELPKPGSQEEQKKDKDKVKEIFNISKSENKNNSKGSSVEKSIINKIGK